MLEVESPDCILSLAMKLLTREVDARLSGLVHVSTEDFRPLAREADVRIHNILMEPDADADALEAAFKKFCAKKLAAFDGGVRS